MKLLARFSSFYYLRSIDRSLKRLADAMERAHPKPSGGEEFGVTIDEYEEPEDRSGTLDANDNET
jgi:hypothetical protein